MSIFALSDPHLSFGTPNKSMDVFGPLWEGYTDKIEKHWREMIGPDDLVLLPGDISWATHLKDALPDLQWLHQLPGTKVISKGNHDFWWSSSQKMAHSMPSSIHFIHNNVFNWKDVTVGGARLWDTQEYAFYQHIHFQENPRATKKSEEATPSLESDEKIFLRELERLKLSLKQLNPQAKTRIAMVHYPPVGNDLKPSRASALLEEHLIDICVFGHLHSLKKEAPLFGEARGVRYILTSCDYLDFIPLRIL